MKTEQLFKVGYCRVSTDEQAQNTSLDNQQKELESKGVKPEHIFRESESSEKDFSNRKQYDNAIKCLEKHGGGELLVTTMDRFSRSGISQTILEIERLRKKNISLIALDLPQVENPEFRALIQTMFSFVANLEIQHRKRRQRIAIDSILQGDPAIRRQKYPGRKSKLTQAFYDEVKEYLDLNFSQTKIARIMRCSRTTVALAIKKLKTQESEIKTN